MLDVNERGLRSMTIHPVILCGGKGSRLWPLSRQSMPKQFIPLWSDKTCFQETVTRVRDSAFADPVIVTSHDYRFIVGQQLSELGVSATILLEPEGRNSGPAIAAAAAWLLERDPDSVMAVLAADHRIDDHDGFRQAIFAAAGAAESGSLVVFGIKPDAPATGYGYVKPGDPIDGTVCHVESFVEKPDRKTASDYIQKGYLWNSGNFLLRADTVLDEYRASDPQTVAAVEEAVRLAENDLDFTVLQSDPYCRAKPQSIDYAVMEKTRAAAVVPVSYAWSDVGNWQTLWELSDKSEAGNLTRGPVDLIDTHNSYIDSHADRLTAVLGLDDIVVINTQDAVLVADRSRANEVGDMVKLMAASGREQALNHRRFDRPWGWYETLDLADRYQVKRVVVYPGGRLSLQKHFHRSEHWVVVRGSAIATVDDTVKLLREGESIYIPLGGIHRLENQGKIDLEIIEVQTGSYLGEDDIVRLDDVYGRIKPS